MNKVLPWLKANWLIAVLSLLILIILPTSLIISSGMKAGLREEVQRAVDADSRDLSSATINYRIVSPIPGVPDVEHNGVASRKIIDWFRVKRDEIQSEAAQVWTKALAFNKADHAPLMEGLFPKPPPSADDRVARNDFTRLVVEKVPKDLLAAINAGGPPEPAKLSADILEHAYRRYDQLRAQHGVAELNKEHGEDLQRELAGIRLEHYHRRADEISVYADAGSFPDFPADMPTNPPTLGYCWEWQEAVWALEDFVRAVALANTTAPDRPAGVAGSVVKRLIRVKVNEPPGRYTGDAAAAYGGGGLGGDDSGLIKLEPSVSLTGRVSGRGTENDLYDVRLIEAELIISTRHIPVFINALASTNFMTVLDMDLSRVEPMEDLVQGYVYGEGEHVVKANMLIETLWFRDWVAPHMPADVRATRGVKDPEPGAGEDPSGTG